MKNVVDEKKSQFLPILRTGKFPDTEYYQIQKDSIETRQIEFSNEPLTQLEEITLRTYFAIHPELVAGTELDGSGFLNPTKTDGNYEDVIRVLDTPIINTIIINTEENSTNTDSLNSKPSTKTDFTNENIITRFVNKSTKRSVEDFPNVVIRQITDFSGNTISYLYGFHDGTKQSMREVGERITKTMYLEFPDVSNASSRFLITDERGIPAYTMSPNLNHIEPVTSKQNQFYTVETSQMNNLNEYEFNFSNIGHSELGKAERDFIQVLRELGAVNIENPSGFVNGLRFKYGNNQFLVFDNGGEFKLDNATKGNDGHLGIIEFGDHTAQSAATQVVEMAQNSIDAVLMEPLKRDSTNTAMLRSGTVGNTTFLLLV
jgi:hypothetical protein